MKKGLVSKLGGAALVLTLVTASLVGGTFAKYTKTISGTATATVAKFNLTSTGMDAAIDLGVLTPVTATSTEKAIQITSDSDVDMSGTITISANSGVFPSWAKLYIKDNTTETKVELGTPFIFEIPKGTTTAKEYKLLCKTTDTSVGDQAAETITLNVEVVGEQKTVTAP